jgi:hypothetical protein
MLRINTLCSHCPCHYSLHSCSMSMFSLSYFVLPPCFALRIIHYVHSLLVRYRSLLAVLNCTCTRHVVPRTCTVLFVYVVLKHSCIVHSLRSFYYLLVHHVVSALELKLSYGDGVTCVDLKVLNVSMYGT